MAAVRASSLPSEKSVATRISFIAWLMVPEAATPGPVTISGFRPARQPPAQELRERRGAAQDLRETGPSTGHVRHGDLKRRAALGDFQRDGAPVAFDDPLAERQAEPAPLRLGGEERLEDSVAHFREGRAALEGRHVGERREGDVAQRLVGEEAWCPVTITLGKVRRRAKMSSWTIG